MRAFRKYNINQSLSFEIGLISCLTPVTIIEFNPQIRNSVITKHTIQTWISA